MRSLQFLTSLFPLMSMVMAQFTSQPALVTSMPALVTSMPALVTSMPALVTSMPALVTSMPALVTSMPALVTSQPALVTSQPALVTSQPALVTSQPALVTSQPALVTSMPALVTSMPALVTSMPELVTIPAGLTPGVYTLPDGSGSLFTISIGPSTTLFISNTAPGTISTVFTNPLRPTNSAGLPQTTGASVSVVPSFPSGVAAGGLGSAAGLQAWVAGCIVALAGFFL